MKKIISIILTLAVSCTALAGCVQNATSPTPPPQSSLQANTHDSVSYPVTIEDHLDRSVTIEEEPKSIVSGYYITTGLLIALGLEDDLVGIEAKADTREIYKLSAPQIISLPSVGTSKEFDLEGAAALNPDLVILPVRLRDVIPSLEALGITAIAVNPEDDDLLEETIQMIGAATNTVSRAKALMSFADTKLDELERQLENTSEPVVYLAGNSSLLSTAGDNMYQDQLIDNAEGKNAAEELDDSYWAEISYEQLIAWNPDYIILAADASYTPESVLQDASLQAVKAVQNGNVYKIPGSIEAWDSPLPSSFLGSLWLASVIHPDRYSAEQFKSAVTEFYETFYDFTPDVSTM